MKVPAKILKLLPRDKETHSLEKKMVKKEEQAGRGVTLMPLEKLHTIFFFWLKTA